MTEPHPAALTPEQIARTIALPDGLSFRDKDRLWQDIADALRSAYALGEENGCRACIAFVRGYNANLPGNPDQPPSEIADALQAAAIRATEADHDR